MTAGLVAVAWLVSVSPMASGAGESPPFGIGVVYDGADRAGEPAPPMRELMDRVRDEVSALTKGEFDVRFLDDRVLSGDWSPETIHACVDRLMADPDVHLVLAFGVLSTADVGRRRELPKPAIGSYAVDAEVQRLPLVGDTTGVRNLNYLVSPGSSARDLEAFLEIVRVPRIHVLVDSLILESLPGLEGYSETLEGRLGVKLEIVPAASSAREALERIPPTARAVYVTPLVRMSMEEFDRLVAGLIERGLPSFSLLGQSDVERGILAGRRPPTDLPRRARRIALNIQRILLGEDAGTLPVTLDEPERLVINMATARAIGLPIRWRVLSSARLLDEAGARGRSLTLEQAVDESIRANLILRAKDRAVAAGEQDVLRARAVLRPQVDATALGLQIDEDRAAASLGSQPERSVSGGVSLSQVLYSDRAAANLSVSRNLQQSLRESRETLRLDIARDTAAAFLDVLRAGTLEAVRRENLRRTESHLDLARRRERIGYSGPADVFRWESELARDRSAVIAASNQVLAAKAVLNRLLHRPIEEPFEPRSPSLGDPELLTGHGRLAPYLDTPEGVERFREFLVREGLADSPEIRELDWAIAAQRRALLAARRAFWSPDLVLFAQVEREFSRGGAGSGGALPILPFEPPDRNSWSVALKATLPLWAGGERSALARQASEDLSRLKLQRDAVAEAIELAVRTAMFSASSTFPAIELAQESAEAARKNLELVTDAYSQGVVSIIDLLDAQNASLVAEENAANAVYEFLLDLMDVQRAANSFGFFMSEQEREAWFQRLEAFFAEPRGSDSGER